MEGTFDSRNNWFHARSRVRRGLRFANQLKRIGNKLLLVTYAMMGFLARRLRVWRSNNFPVLKSCLWLFVDKSSVTRSLPKTCRRLTPDLFGENMPLKSTLGSRAHKWMENLVTPQAML